MNPLSPASVIVFQYNPADVGRSLRPKRETDRRIPVGTRRLTGPPREKIDIQINVNAIDQLDTGSPVAAALGVYPHLCAMEMLLYPPRATVLASTAKLALGVLEITPPEAPLTVLVFGTRRVAPVQLASYRARETLHDPGLVPINATVSLGLDILTYEDFLPSQPGFYLSLVNQAVRETMAAIGTIGDVASVVGGALQLA